MIPGVGPAESGLSVGPGHHSWLRPVPKTECHRAGTSSWALSSSMALAIRPATPPECAGSAALSSAGPAKAEPWPTAGCHPAWPDVRAGPPATASAESRWWRGRSDRCSVHCSQPPRGTTRHDSKAGARADRPLRIGSELWCVVAPITGRSAVQTRCLVEVGLPRGGGSNGPSPSAWRSSRATRATVASSKSRKGRSPRPIRASTAAAAERHQCDPGCCVRS